jgi:hypothetical protein
MARTTPIQSGILWLVLFTALSLSARAPAREITVTNSIAIPHGAKWKPIFWLGNVDDPLPPADYRPHDEHRVGEWYLRNPTHNFTFYVIGVADKKFRRSGAYPDKVFNPHGGWNFAVCKYRWARLPFVSYQKSKFKFYLGWRERGNFGMKFQL